MKARVDAAILAAKDSSSSDQREDQREERSERQPGVSLALKGGGQKKDVTKRGKIKEKNVTSRPGRLKQTPPSPLLLRFLFILTTYLQPAYDLLTICLRSAYDLLTIYLRSAYDLLKIY